MKKSKQVMAGLLTVVMVCVATACGSTSGKQAAEVTEDSVIEIGATETESETETQIQTETAMDYSQLVADAYTEDVAFQDFTFTFQVPEIRFESADVTAVNTAIRSEADQHLEKAISDANAGYFTSDCGGITYDWYVTDNMLTLLISTYLYPDASGWDDYTVYTIDLSDGHQLTDEEIWMYKDYNKDEYLAKVREAMGCYFWNCYGDAFKNGNAGQESFVIDRFNYTVSEKTVSAAIPFLNKDGQLCVVGSIGSIAAGSQYPHIVNLEDYEIPDYYTKYIGDVSGGEKTDDQSGVSTGDYILAESDSRFYTSEEIMSLSARDLMLARNEIYARHGRKFNDAELSAYFNSKSWYNGTIAPEAFDASVLNKYEIDNIDMIKMVEDM